MDNMNPIYRLNSTGTYGEGYNGTRSPMSSTAQTMQQPVYAPPPKPSPAPVLRTPIYPPINGRTITTEQEITPRDIPMDGSVTYFPLADFSAIIGKYWDDTGTLRKMCFVRTDESNQNGSENGVTLDMVLAKLEEIETKLHYRSSHPKKPYRPKETTTESTKEDSK